MALRVYFIAGSTSNLATTALLPLLTAVHHTLYATHHYKTADGTAYGPSYIDTEEALGMAQRGELDRALWLSPTVDAATLASFAKLVPTLEISNMSLASHLTTGKPSHAELNAYQLGKLSMATVAEAYHIAPGFYLEDADTLNSDCEVLSVGLHAETSTELLRPQGTPFVAANPHTFYEKPPMSVTPKTTLARAIARWIAAPAETMTRGVFTVLCSNGEYSRMQLRLLALGEPISPPADKFSALPHPRAADGNQMYVSHDDVAGIMRGAYAKRQKTVDNAE